MARRNAAMTPEVYNAFRLNEGSELAALLDGFDDYDVEDLSKQEQHGMALLNQRGAGQLGELAEHPSVLAALEVIAEITG